MFVRCALGALLVAGSGCDKLFGLEEAGEGDDIGPAPDADPTPDAAPSQLVFDLPSKVDDNLPDPVFSDVAQLTVQANEKLAVIRGTFTLGASEQWIEVGLQDGHVAGAATIGPLQMANPPISTASMVRSDSVVMLAGTPPDVELSTRTAMWSTPTVENDPLFDFVDDDTFAVAGPPASGGALEVWVAAESDAPDGAGLRECVSSGGVLTVRNYHLPAGFVVTSTPFISTNGLLLMWSMANLDSGVSKLYVATRASPAEAFGPSMGDHVFRLDGARVLPDGVDEQIAPTLVGDPEPTALHYLSKNSDGNLWLRAARLPDR